MSHESFLSPVKRGGGDTFTSPAGVTSFLLSPKEDSQSVEFLSQGELLSAATTTRSKTFHDRVHDQMTFQPLICAIIDTPQFQRLRDLHQLGNCRYIYPGACNTRFEHSLGVAHLGMKMLRQIRTNHEEEDDSVLSAGILDITKNDILCIGVAGLCHDLGHGPLSHMFETFVNRVRKEKGTIDKKGKWEHETASIEMLDYLLKDNKINLEEYGLVVEDLNFIKVLIHGLSPSDKWPDNIGRPKEKRFLFDIVANQRNGIDVDKLDYFLRDSMSAFGKLPDIHVDRILQCTRVCIAEGQTQVCFQEKVAMSLGELFQLRAKLHKFVYQHRVVLVLDHMVVDALAAAEDHYKITVPRTGATYTLSETVEDMEAYVQTGDWIFNAIQWSSTPELQTSRDILRRIRTRNLYTLVGMYSFKQEKQDHDIYVDKIRKFMDPRDLQQMTSYNIFVATSRIKLGSSGDKEKRDPLDNVRFFNPKINLDNAYSLSKNRKSPIFSPGALEEFTAFVFSRDPFFGPALHDAFNLWWAEARKSSLEVQTPVSFAQPSPFARKRPREGDFHSNKPVTLNLSEE
jgi:deoxynucleoside triphosphate triphosphohydrolase SAMHD1